MVISIIALLIGILLPTLGKSRAAARAVVCENNLKQFGLGFAMYSRDAKGQLPWEGFGDGDKASKPLGPWNDQSLWVNAVPPYVNGKAYYDMQQADAAGAVTLPGSGAKNAFVCPDAGPAQGNAGDTVQDGYFMMYGNQEGTPAPYPGNNVDQRKMYWCYVFNSKLNNSSYAINDVTVKQTSATPILVEKMMQPGEDLTYTDDLCRCKTTWTRFTSRHNLGGYLVFLDGHVRFFTRAAVNVQTVPGDYNKPGILEWNPLGPAD